MTNSFDLLYFENLIKENHQDEFFISATETINDWITYKKEFQSLYDFLIEDNGEEVIQENVSIITKLLETSLENKYKIHFDFHHCGGRGFSFVELKGINVSKK